MKNKAWQDLLKMHTLEDFSACIRLARKAVEAGKTDENVDTVRDIIHMEETLQERAFIRVTDEIIAKNRHIVLIAGPSSSGKTTTSHRLALHLMTLGYVANVVSLDDYFVNREDTPLDEEGKYDYEHVDALNRERLNSDINALLNGERVRLPLYDFKSGRSKESDRYLSLSQGEVIIFEGIHALNPTLFSSIENDKLYRIYASPTTPTLLCEGEEIPTTYVRLVRRMNRDYKYRGTSAIDTLARWQSVRRGERLWIEPFKHLADEEIDTSLFFELAVLKGEIMPILRAIDKDSEYLSAAEYLISLLSNIEVIPIFVLPMNSILREFL